ncbi:ribonuclease E/G [Breoghania sp. L-A4]|uniref:Rne/Rng family ribonuclease n=1 Tax=Breoghania sp. L-A4 TaxID=2304600 RepID=UPI000E35BAC3|nr:ribonuclease E/G [Breoghania sp. L-A4]AXS40834.1 ribonuclease E/G [Breoghania sp. L-A4]
MANKMLIDAAHPEETRVVVVRGNRVEEFDFEAANRKQLRGNIYLAKVTRVEPSLQAAFVDYGGNRHGFLAFSEIHPDFYQIPVADRKALLEQEEAEAAEDEAASSKSRSSRPSRRKKDASVSESAEDAEAAASAGNVDEGSDDDAESDNLPPSGHIGNVEDTPEDDHDDDEPAAKGDADVKNDDELVESVGAEDAMEEVPVRRARPRRHYKIQEVIKRRQVLLVQVVKEERGNKGAALTTYLSLAGRYSVLMPNTGRGGGISRKITNVTDRKRLKTVANELEVPEGMGVILRTAGASRTKAEIKRDFEYLLRLWENVRELTLRSVAPCLVYEEGSLVKRSIRDLYNKDIDEILVAGEDAYREAKDFMRMLMPSHAKNVQPYRSSTPVFTKHGVEAQLDAMFSPDVTLRSGGYIVINQTEALVAIDVNSGKSTREHSIEDTALQTNLEAAEEVARQLRLRDLAGLIVIDFIDMEENRNNRAVEKRMKDSLKSDRARIQVGRISHFGLLEMSRQRIRTGVLESSTEHCPHCHGSGMIRSTESVALHVLRALEDHLLRHSSHHINVRTHTPAALYILNQKRHHLMELEMRFGLNIAISADEEIGTQHFVLDRGEPAIGDEAVRPAIAAIVHPDTIMPEIEDEDDIEEEIDEEIEEATVKAETASDDGTRKRKRRRRRRGGDASESGEQADAKDASKADDDEAPAEKAASAEGTDDEEGDDDRPKKRRRGRRGGRRGRRGRDASEAGSEDTDAQASDGESGNAETAQADDSVSDPGEAGVVTAVGTNADDTGETPEPVEAASEPAETAADEPEAAEAPVEEAPVDVSADETPAVETPAVETKAVEMPAEAAEEPAEEPVTAEAPQEAEEPVSDVAAAVAEEPAAKPAKAAEDKTPRKKRSGWWQRGGSFF